MVTRIATLLVLAALGSAPAWAAKVYATAAVHVDVGDTVNCAVANLGTREAHLDVEAVNTGGVSILRIADIRVLAGGTNRIQAGIATVGSDQDVYCRFTLLSGSSRDVRASLCARPAGGRCVLSIDAR